MKQEAYEVIQIEEQAKRQYGSLRQPNYSFILECYNSKQNKDFNQLVLNIFDAREISDLNYDLCRSYELDIDSQIWFLEISLVVQKYYCLYRVKSCGLYMFADESDGVELQGVQRKLLNFFDLVYLNRSVLEQNSDIFLSDYNEERGYIYNTLFSTELPLPWFKD